MTEAIISDYNMVQLIFSKFKLIQGKLKKKKKNTKVGQYYGKTKSLLLLRIVIGL